MGEDRLSRSFSLEGRVAVVTGAASGIGRETAVVLTEAGASVVIGDVQEEGLARTAALLAGQGARAISRHTDVSIRAEVDALAQAALETFGRVDVWVNCAGIMIRKPMLEVDEAALDRGIGINLKGVYWGCVAAGQAMRARGGGSIVNISSGGGDSAVPDASIYNLTKAAVNMITRSTAKEMGKYGIRANTIAPGYIDTPMIEHAFLAADGSIDADKRAEIMSQRAQVSPLGLTGTPRDIALTVLFLASDASRFTTGQIIRPNGGVTMP